MNIKSWLVPFVASLGIALYPYGSLYNSSAKESFNLENRVISEQFNNNEKSSDGKEVELVKPPENSFKAPVEYGQVSSLYGADRSGDRVHRSVDIAIPVSDFTNYKAPYVLASKEGRVSEVSRGPLAGYYVKIQHSGGWETIYSHLDPNEIKVSPGEFVSLGDTIGQTGSSGFSSYSTHGREPIHLDFQIKKNGVNVNPSEHLINYEGQGRDEMMGHHKQILCGDKNGVLCFSGKDLELDYSIDHFYTSLDKDIIYPSLGTDPEDNYKIQVAASIGNPLRKEELEELSNTYGELNKLILESGVNTRYKYVLDSGFKSINQASQYIKNELGSKDFGILETDAKGRILDSHWNY